MSPAEIQKHIKTLQRFVGVYCHKKHGTPKEDMCPSCQDLLSYASDRLARCPYDPKPKCKDCKTHCYKEPYRQRIAEVMRFSGTHFVKRGRLDWLVRFFLQKS